MNEIIVFSILIAIVITQWVLLHDTSEFDELVEFRKKASNEISMLYSFLDRNNLYDEYKNEREQKIEIHSDAVKTYMKNMQIWRD